MLNALSSENMWFIRSCCTHCKIIAGSYFENLWSALKSFFFFKFIILRENERVSMSRGGAEREGERESQAGPALSVQSPTWGLNSGAVRS